MFQERTVRQQEQRAVQGFDRLEIRCASGTLAVLPYRLLLRGPQAWAVPRAIVAHVSCAEDGLGGFDLTLHLVDGRRFVLKGFTAAELLRLSTELDDIEGLPTPTPHEGKPSNADMAPESRPPDSPPSDLPPAEYVPDRPGTAPTTARRSGRPADILLVESLPTVPLTAPGTVASPPHGPRSYPDSRPQVAPAAANTPPAAERARPPQELPTWMSPAGRIWLPRVTLPPLPTAAFIENPVEPPTPVENVIESNSRVESPSRPLASPADLPAGERAAASPPATAVPHVSRHQTSGQPSNARGSTRRRARAFWP